MKFGVKIILHEVISVGNYHYFFALSKRNTQTENYHDMLVKRLISLKYYFYLSSKRYSFCVTVIVLLRIDTTSSACIHCHSIKSRN